MTAPIQEAVRRACDAVAGHSKCQWPTCNEQVLGCIMFLTEEVAATLIAQARAEGAAQEREACAKVAEERQVDDQGNALWLVWPDGHDIAAAIRARKEEPKP